MLWIIALIIVVIISLFLALRSMKDFQESPKPKIGLSLYLIRNKIALNTSVLEKMGQLTAELDSIISLERLCKGSDCAFAVFGPTNLPHKIPELNLLELEDYLAENDSNSLINPNKVEVNESFGWVISSKNNPKKPLTVHNSFLKMVDLLEEQRFSWQIVASPQKGNTFQVTIRALVTDKNPVRRIELAKKIDKDINQHTGLIQQARQQTTTEIFEAFKKRSIIPKEVSEFILTLQEILDLLSI